MNSSEGDKGRRAALGIGAAAVGLAVFGGTVGAMEQWRQAVRDTTLRVNGQDHRVHVDPSTPLLYVLRNDLGLQGPRFGCGMAQCGACTVQLEGRPVRSCVTKMSAVGGRAVTTLEGLGSTDKPHPLQKAFVEHQAVQCGYCISGMIMEAEAFLRSTPKPTGTEIKTALAGHLCRCGTHYRIVKAVKAAAGTL
jgi:nicotinate dehydrogenase subunit A